MKLLWIIPIVVFLTMTFGIMKTVPMWQDEYVFYRITSQLPDLSVTSDWFYKDNPKTLEPSSTFPVDRKELFHLIYDMPIYSHSPLANYLSSPFVKLANLLADVKIIPHIEDDPKRAEAITLILRIIPMTLFAGTLTLIFHLLYRKFGDYAYLFSVPVFFSSGLLAGVYYFYWDAFMWFFFFLTLYLMERKSKWAYLTACCLVNTKIVIGMMLLIPLIIQNKKMIFTALAFVPFYIATWVVTGNPLYMITHLIPQTSQYSWIYMFWTNEIIWNVGLVWYALLTLPILFLIKKYPAYVATYLIVLWYAWGFGIAPDKMSAMLYSGALVFPIIVYELYPKIKAYAMLSVVKQ